MHEYWFKQTMKKSKQEKRDVEISAMTVHLLILKNYYIFLVGYSYSYTYM